MKVCHLTSVHKWNDTRIFYKECVSLAMAGYEVSLIVPHEKSEVINGIKIINVAPTNGSRLKRATVTCYRILKKAIKEKASIYHFHDPELIWVGIILRILGKKVIFDIHENIRAQIKVKEWLPLRNIISKIYGIVDWLSAKLFFLILAENSYEEIYRNLNANYITVLNFPSVQFLEKYIIEDRSHLSNGILYVGSVTKYRGIDVVIEALNILDKKNIDFHFYCVGPIDKKLEEEIQKTIKELSLEKKISLLGRIPIDKAYEYSKDCKVGISILQPIENYLNSYSTKIFEYMSIGLPVIVSDFELYNFVKNNNACGICINPNNPIEIADAIQTLFENTLQSKQMGENGKKAVREYYNWENEAEKLTKFYQGL